MPIYGYICLYGLYVPSMHVRDIKKLKMDQDLILTNHYEAISSWSAFDGAMRSNKKPVELWYCTRSCTRKYGVRDMRAF